MNMNPTYSRRTFLKTLGVTAIAAPYITRGLMARSRIGTLRHASFGALGMAFGDLSEIGKCPGVELVAICDVDLSRTAKALELFPKAKVYQDWRVLLDKEGKNLDSANVSTPDHMHASIAVSAMQLGINVYGQKPLAHDVYEVRRMMKIAHKKKVVTQMGIHMHSSAAFRTAVRVVEDGAIGKVKEVHSWCPKSWGDSSAQAGPNGSCAREFRLEPLARRVRGSSLYRRRILPSGQLAQAAGFRHRHSRRHGLPHFRSDFHFLGSWPSRFLSARKARRRTNGTGRSTARSFTSLPGRSRTASKILPITWYDGAAKPSAEVIALLEGDALPDSGSIFIGTEGVMLLPNYLRPTLYPKAKFKDYESPTSAKSITMPSSSMPAVGRAKPPQASPIPVRLRKPSCWEASLRAFPKPR